MLFDADQSNRPKKLPQRLILGLLVILASFTALGVLSREGATTATDSNYFHQVRPFYAEEQPSYDLMRRLSGVISARQHAEIGFEQGGKIAVIHVDEGDLITRGELVAEMDTELLDIEATQLRAQLADIESRLKLARSSLRRNLELKQQGFASEQRIDELEAEQASLAASIESIKARQASNRSRIEKSVLKAPFDGIVSRRFVDQGAVVNAGTALVRLQEEGRMEAHVGIPIPLIPAMEKAISRGLPLTVMINSIATEANVLAVGADMNPVTRTVSARLSLPGLPNVINGDLMTLLLPETIDQAGFWVPISAITDGMRGLWTVYALMPTGDQSEFGEIYRIESRDIHVEYTTGDQAYIQGSLESGEAIVHGGLNRFVPGQRVLLKRNSVATGSTVMSSPGAGE